MHVERLSRTLLLVLLGFMDGTAVVCGATLQTGAVEPGLATVLNVPMTT
jgi:hypothetical protein